MSDDPTRADRHAPAADQTPVQRFEARRGIETLLRLDGAAARSWASRRPAAGTAAGSAAGPAT